MNTHPTSIGDRVVRISIAHGPGTVRTVHDETTSCDRCTGGRAHMQVEWEDTPGETFDEDPADLALIASAAERIVPPVPRGTVCEKMCKRCPFKPDGSGYAQDHPDLPRIITSVDLGLPFYCHETVIFDERTTMDTHEEQPDPPVQDHFELCRGGHERRMATWVSRAAVARGTTEAEIRRRAGLTRLPEPAPAAPAIAPAPVPGAAGLRRDVNTGRAWLLFPTRPDAATITALKGAGWRWSGFRKEWHHPRKFIVPPPGVAYVDEGTVNYSDERAERSAASAETARAEAAAAFRREEQIGSMIPMGQPILVGHHSERRHRRDIERIQKLAEKGVEATRKAERLENRAGSSARLRERRQTDPGLVERRLRRLRKTLSYMEAILLKQGDKADDERVRRAHLVRDEIARNVQLLDEINAELPDDAPVGVGDVVPGPHGHFLVGRVNHRTFTGWVVGGGADAWPGRLDKTKWNGKVTVRANEKLRTAVEHRVKLGGYYGDETWRKLTAEGIKEAKS